MQLREGILVSSPLDDSTISVAPLEPVPVVALTEAAPRFCTRCGQVLSVEGECARCLSRRPREVLPLEADDGGHRSIKGAMSLYFSLLAICMIGTIASLAGAGELAVDIGVSVGLTAVVIVGVAISWRGVLPLLARVPNPLWFVAGIGLSFLTLAIAMGIIIWVQHLAKLPGQKMSTPFVAAGYGWGMVVLFWCVQPAIFEELAFRGTVMSALSKALSPFETVMVSALMFMILHLSPARFPHTFALGLSTGYLRLRTRSLYPGILLHFCHNFACVAIEWAGH
jgi:membrane protease YdiL (CAAX protease family)